MVSVKSTTPSAPPAFSQAPPPGYGQPPPPPGAYVQDLPPGYAQPPPPVYGQAPPPAAGIPFQPNPPAPGGVPGAWSSGLCDCGVDVPLCCVTCWCPCITFGQIAEIVDRGSTSCGASGAIYTLISLLTGCACIYSCFYRTKMRRQYMLPESPCPDCLLHFCCETCALCQEYRELQHRGFDLSIGWHGNVEKQNQGANMPPFVHGGMHR